MALSIKDEETDRLVKELATLTGENYTKTIKHAVMEKLQRAQKRSQQTIAARNKRVDEWLESRKDIVFPPFDHKAFLDDLWEM